MLIKKLFCISLFAVLVISCKFGSDKPKDYVTISGKISGLKDTLIIMNGDMKAKGFSKNILVNADGSFKDTLKIPKKGDYVLLGKGASKDLPDYEASVTRIYLSNGYDLNVMGSNSKDLETNLKFTGTGSESNNLITSLNRIITKFGNQDSLFILDKPAFDIKVKSLEKDFKDSFELYKNADSTFLADNKLQVNRLFEYLKKEYENQHHLVLNKAEIIKKVVKGKPSPEFVNYKNAKGGITSLSDFKGKYVYIDLWATWCGPCKDEIPHLKKIEESYRGKNIVFVSISLDDQRTSGTFDKAEKAWKKMVADEHLTGVQLFAGEDKKFANDYFVRSIPRFILIDPKGNIVDKNAPRPSQAKLKELFEQLGL